MIHEMRVYHCVPGKLPALLDRFDKITLKIWQRMGIRQAGFWTVAIGESNYTLIYLLAWGSLAEREEKWTDFLDDPEWQTKRAETEANGPLLTHVTNQILQPTAFSVVRREGRCPLKLGASPQASSMRGGLNISCTRNSGFSVMGAI